MTTDEVNVFWSPHAAPHKVYQQILMDLKPEPLMKDIQARRATKPIVPQGRTVALGGNYQACSALHVLAENSYVIKAPFDVEIRLDKAGVVDPNSKHLYWLEERISSIQNAFSVDFDMPFLFFSEEPLVATLSPAYMHRLSYSNNGFVVPGKFDISSWFRPFPIIFQLWENEQALSFKKGEPLAYLSFDTDKKVNLKQFVLTEDIFNQVKACGEHKEFIPYQSMDKLYERFDVTGMKSIVLKSIKQNLVDNEG